MDQMGEMSGSQTEQDYSLEKELAWMREQEQVSDGFDELYKAYWQTHDQKWKPAISGVSFAGRPPRMVESYVEDFIFAGCIAAIVGPPKVGKSTFVWEMVAALVEGKPFLGKETRLPGSVLYVSEQGEFSFDMQLARMPGELRERILRSGKFFLMLPEHHLMQITSELETPVLDWAGRMALWKKAIKNTKADIFVLDTFGQYADLGPQGENDNALMSKRILELRQLQKERPSLAILLLAHSNKASAKKRFLELRDIRGGSALAGGLDHGVTFNKSGLGNARFVGIESRMKGDAKKIVVWLKEGGYVDGGELSIRELQELLGVSYRQARKVWASIRNEDEGESGTDDSENPIPDITR